MSLQGRVAPVTGASPMSPRRPADGPDYVQRIATEVMAAL